MNPRSAPQGAEVFARAYVAALPASMALRTRTAYERYVMVLIGYLRSRRPNLRLVTTADLNAYVLWLLERNSPATANVHRSAVRRFFAWQTKGTSRRTWRGALIIFTTVTLGLGGILHHGAWGQKRQEALISMLEACRHGRFD